MARALIVGCGCHGRELGVELLDRGWQVRGTTRTVAGEPAIGEAGIEAARADPDRPGTILEACGDISVVVWLLGSAFGEPDALAAIHGPRLERLLEKLVDSPVRGFAYEAGGSVPEELREAGRDAVERAAVTWRIPVAILEGERAMDGCWAESTADSVAAVLERR